MDVKDFHKIDTDGFTLSMKIPPKVTKKKKKITISKPALQRVETRLRNFLFLLPQAALY